MFKFAENIVDKRSGKIISNFSDFIEKGDKVLDIGAGGGWIARALKKRKGADITLLDITNFNQTSLKLVLYDGKKIPFPDNTFDTSLLVFTLHHCTDPLIVLEEAKRVTRGNIIIAEDIPTSFLNRIFLCFWDVIVNMPSVIKLPGENISFKFKTVFGWNQVFEKFKLKSIFQKGFKSNSLIRHHLFVVRK